MSVEAITWAKKARVGDSSAKLLLLVLADYANHENIAWPSQQTLADITELSKPTVIRKLKLLEEKGLITRVKRYRVNGSNASNQYELGVGGSITVTLGGYQGDTTSNPQIEPTDNNMSHSGAKEQPKQQTNTRSNAYSDWFDRLWDSYPKMVKGRTNPKRGCYLKAKGWLNKGYTEEDLIAAARGYAASKPNPQYVQMGQTFYGPSAAFEQFIDAGKGIDSTGRKSDTTGIHRKGRVVQPEELLDEDHFI